MGKTWGCNITHFESGEAVFSQKEVQNRFKGAGSLLFFTVAISMLITSLETLLFLKVRIGTVMLSDPPLVLTEVIGKEWPGLFLCASTWEYNEQDLNEND